jgi:hypothetical protein
MNQRKKKGKNMYAKSIPFQQEFLKRSFAILTIITLLMLALPVATASAAEVGYFSPSAAAVNGKTAWTNPSFSFSSNDQYTSTAGKNKQLKLSAFNITPIQGNSIINGIEVTLEGHTDGRQVNVSISGNGGASWTSAKTSGLPIGSADSLQILGGSGDKWGGTWASDNFTNTQFRVRVTSASTNNGFVYIDHVQVKIYFQPPNATLTVSPISENYGTGTTTLTATLTETTGGAAIVGKTVDFTLQGASVGSGVTDGSGVASVPGVNISGLASGTYGDAIRADFAGDGGYPATYGLADLTIVGLPLTVTADPQTKHYGYPEPTLTYQYTGTLLSGDSFTGGLLRDPGDIPGDYFINQGTLTAGPGYNITYVGDFLTIDQAPLTVTADSFAKNNNDPAITSFTFTYDGFVFVEDATALTTEPTCELAAGVDQTIAGTYPITCSGGVADNYSFTYEAGSLVVTAVAEPPLPLTSIAAQDGWVRESGEFTKKGGAMNATATTLRLGDDALNRQYRSILSFDTSALPSNAVITKVTLHIAYQGKTGTSPFRTHGNLLVDLKLGNFGTSNLLQKADFQSLATLNSAGIVGKVPVSTSIYESILTPTALTQLNTQLSGTGLTQVQLRLRFTKDDNNDFGADFLKFYTSNSLIPNTQPVLIIEYYVH